MNRASVLLAGLIVLLVPFFNACGEAQVSKISPTPAPTSTIPPVNFSPIVTRALLPTRNPEPTGVARGMEIFQGQGACVTCHTIQGVSEAGIGPELTTIGVTAATRIPGYSAEEYIIESIRRPGAYVVEGYPRDLMTEALTRHLTEDEVNFLAAFLIYQQ